MRILLAGGSGLIGTALRKAAQERGHEVGLLLRRDPAGPHQWRWNPAQGRVPGEAIGWADGIVNLSGASIGRVPWTGAYKRTLLASRVTATQTLAAAIARAERPPSVLVSGSAVGYYGDRPGETLDERSAAGTSFLARLCVRWEAAARRAASDRTRVATIRTGLVLARGGALGPLQLATRLGVGARVGAGTQVWPWIALADEVGAILHLLTHEVSGPVNLTAPAVSTSEDVTRGLAHAMHRPHWMVLPAPLLRLALGDAADDVLLLSQQVHPEALLASGYEFGTTDLHEALAAAVGER